MNLRAMVMDVGMVMLWSWMMLMDWVMMLNGRILVLDRRVVHVVVLRLVDDVMSDVVFLRRAMDMIAHCMIHIMLLRRFLRSLANGFPCWSELLLLVINRIHQLWSGCRYRLILILVETCCLLHRLIQSLLDERNQAAKLVRSERFVLLHRWEDTLHRHHWHHWLI